MSNQLLIDDAIAHRIRIMRFADGIADDIRRDLRVYDRELERQLVAYLGMVRRGARPQADPEWRAFVRFLDGHSSLLARAIRDRVTPEVEQFAGYSAERATDVLQQAVDEGDDVTVLPFVVAAAIVVREPALIIDRTYGDWVDGMAEGRKRRVSSESLRMLRDGASVEEIRAAVAGRRTGVLRRSYVAADTVAQTIVGGISANVRRMFADLNSRLLGEDVWISVLDTRTSAICRSLSGRRFPVGLGPFPPQHPNCRSIRQFVLRGRRVEVPTYGEWLARQPADVQDDALGPGFAKVYRAKDLDMSDFVNQRTGKPWSLKELKNREGYDDERRAA